MESTIRHSGERPCLEDEFGIRLKAFQHLMRFKIRDILLVSSLYDSYLFEEDGQLFELIREEFQSLNLSHPPEITQATSGREALELLASGERYDLVITTLHLEDMHVARFAQEIRTLQADLPIVLLAYDNQERKELMANADASMFAMIFIWKGDYRLLIAIIKCMEDRLNVENDTNNVGVQSIILLEDSVNFYSSYLPIIYTEIFHQSRRLISEGVNLTHKFLRLRARPKILLCTTYEEGWASFERYREHVLGIISDINFMHNGEKDPEAGLTFAQKVKAQHGDIPILLQSSSQEFAGRARAIGAGFLLKTSPRLLYGLRKFMMQNFGFGDFVFMTPEGVEVGRARDLRSLEEQLRTVPAESLLYHARENHFSKWLKARTEFSLAHRLRPQRVEEFSSVEQLRTNLVDSLHRYREMRRRGVITEFRADGFDVNNSLARVGTGSLGGKARGLGFLSTLLRTYGFNNRFEGIEITVPSAIVIATDVFDRFLRVNQLETLALGSSDDDLLRRRFVQAQFFPHDVVEHLRAFLDIVRCPLAVRSSSLLEDSQFQPFAGVYDTYMIPNNNPDPAVRLEELLAAVKLVYASTFASKAREYMKATTYRVEEEKMAVLIQRMVGSQHGETFYPEFAGVAKSYNFYPIPPQSSTDGIVMVALGLGKTVVEGGNTVRFCPKYPRHLLQFFSTLETLNNAQQDFAALDLTARLGIDEGGGVADCVRTYDLDRAEKDDTLFYVGSTYCQENESVYDGIGRPGKRVVTFAPILKHKIFPLPEILDLVLDTGSEGMGSQVEIEFAVNLSLPPGQPKEFSLLQIRPLVLSLEMEELDVESVSQASLLVESHQVLGNGVMANARDIVVVDIQTFERGKSVEAAEQVSHMNSKLLQEGRPYILVGVGRWGSMDNWLGIPVTYSQISGACAIVESGFKDFNVTPSQGSHFFQNITSFRIGYFTVSEHLGMGYIDWNWLRDQPAVEECSMVRHLRCDDPAIVKVNGYKNRGIILKPGVKF